eukprot:767559-Hanusia_phi.AAC.3
MMQVFYGRVTALNRAEMPDLRTIDTRRSIEFDRIERARQSSGAIVSCVLRVGSNLHLMPSARKMQVRSAKIDNCEDSSVVERVIRAAGNKDMDISSSMSILEKEMQ